MSNLLMEPWVDAERHQRELDEYESHYPVCPVCGHHVVDGDTYVLYDKDYIHDECFIGNYTKTMGDWRAL